MTYGGWPRPQFTLPPTGRTSVALKEYESRSGGLIRDGTNRLVVRFASGHGATLMTRREKFRHYAEACLRLAEQIVAPDEKALLVSMAQVRHGRAGGAR